MIPVNDNAKHRRCDLERYIRKRELLEPQDCCRPSGLVCFWLEPQKQLLDVVILCDVARRIIIIIRGIGISPAIQKQLDHLFVTKLGRYMYVAKSVLLVLRRKS